MKSPRDGEFMLQRVMAKMGCDSGIALILITAMALIKLMER